MSNDALSLYRRYMAGDPGTCVFTEESGCHAFATEDEIEATYGSRHDTNHFAWIGSPPGLVGFVSDDHIDALLAERRIAYTFSEMNGPAGIDREGARAGFLLGAARMIAVLGLPVDEANRILPHAMASLPLAVRVWVNHLALPSPIPLVRLVEASIPLGATVENPEAQGRFAVLSRAAVGTDLDDIEEEAERCAARIVDRVARKDRTDEAINQILTQLT